MAAPRKKKTSRRRGASRGRKGSGSSLTWFLAGLLIGLGISGLLLLGGYLPERPMNATPAETTQAPVESGPIDDAEEIAGESSDRRFDFFTVLPEMEVMVPEQELSRDAQAGDATTQAPGSDAYILQAGSFKSASDAEQMKARLALLGSVATIQVVTVDGATWHRVRIGPVQGARRADEVRRTLQDNNIQTLVMKSNP